MGKTEQLHSIVLHAHDVGEADRFCILLTKERGKVAARAHGVRKPKSKMGGSILPMQELMMTARDGSSGLHISDCILVHEHMGVLQLSAYIHAAQCVDMLLSLLEDDHPVPEIFALTQEFLAACHNDEVSSVLPFTMQLLCVLGLLPSQTDHAIFEHVSEDESAFLEEAFGDNWVASCPPEVGPQKLTMLCAKIIEEHSKRPLKAAAIACNI